MLGNCIQIACENVLHTKNFLFCYANVMGQGNLKGQRILHAWNELGDLIFDFSNGNKIIIQKEKYYALAKIKEKEVTKQNFDEILKLLLKHKTYGGWIK